MNDAPAIPDWDAVLAPHLSAAQRSRLATARIGIAGAGGLGSNCAVFLVRSGICHFNIADPDVVALSNLNRQHYFPRHLGKPKIQALEEILRELNPRVDLNLSQRALDSCSVEAFFNKCDIVVEAVDNPAMKRMLVETLLIKGHTVVAASGMAGWGGPSMTVRHIGLKGIVVGDHRTELSPSLPPLAPRVIMAAAMQADAVLSFLLGSPPNPNAEP